MLDGTRERTADVAEQLALGEAFGNGRAIERDHWAVAAVADLVDGAGDQLLARAALAVDADVRVAGGRLLDACEDLQDLLGASDEAVKRRALAACGHPRQRRHGGARAESTKQRVHERCREF